MAIAYDNSTSIASWTGSSPATASHTCTGSDLILIVGVFTNGSVTNLTATYNGVSMTRLTFFSDSGGNKNAFFYLVNPATGSNTVSVTRTGGSNMSIVAASYTGVDQTTPIDDSVTDAGDSSSPFPTSNVTVGSADNWLITTMRDNATGVSSTEVSLRVQSGTVLEQIWDSNGTVSSGSQNVTYTFSGALFGHTLVSLAAASSGTDYPMTAAVGTFTLTGIANALNWARTMAAAVGSFTLTGIAVTFQTGVGFAAQVGSFILTGIAATLRAPAMPPAWTPKSKSSTSTMTARSKNQSE